MIGLMTPDPAERRVALLGRLRPGCREMRIELGGNDDYDVTFLRGRSAVALGKVERGPRLPFPRCAR